MNDSIINMLFETNALQVCPEDKPFWYAAGTLGPYYINTHFLFGSKKEAEDLLIEIESAASDKLLFPKKIFEILLNQYENNSIFKQTIDIIVKAAGEMKIDFDFISGGERRDFFFSMMPAYIMQKPHVCIFKDGTTVLTDSNFQNSRFMSKNELTGQKSLHVADLVTEASSYIRAWIPAIEGLGAIIVYSIAVVDRDQGGSEILESKNITFQSFALITRSLFQTAKEKGFINDKQFDMIVSFIDNPVSIKE